jgi:AcrR family transcriptional regulator
MTAERRRANPRAEAVLEVALEHFSKKGYAEVTMQDIARGAGVTYSLLYYYYKNKEDLFHAAVSYSIQKTIENYEKINRPHESPVDAINDWLDHNIQLAEPLKRLVKIMMEFSDRRDGSPSVAQEVDTFYQYEQDLLCKSIRAGVQQGIFTCASPEGVALFVSTYIDGIFYRASLRPQMDIEAAMLELKRMLWHWLDYTPGDQSS